MASLYYVIPAQVFEDDRLGSSEKMFYALLSGLAFSCGYCYATDQYLANRMKLKLRQTKYMLELLEDLKYIRRETIKVGMKWERKIFITHSRLDSNKVCEEQNSAPAKGNTVPFRGAVHCPKVSEEIISESSSSTPSKSKEDPNLLRPTPEEEEELEKRFRERPKGSEKIKSKRLWRESVLKDIRSDKKKESSDRSLAREGEEAFKRNVARAKEIFSEAERTPDAFVGKVSIDCNGILSCCTKAKAFGSLSPKVPPIDWENTVEKWRKQ